MEELCSITYIALPLNLPDYNKPIQIESYAIQDSLLDPIESLWEDEVDAATLCKLLTP